MALCKCGCGQEIIQKKSHKYDGIPKYISGHNSKIYNSNKNPYPSIPDLCYCGCGQIVWNGKQFILGHHSKLNPPFKNKIFSEEHKRKMSENHADFSKEKHPMWGRHQSDKCKQGKIGDLNPAKRPEVRKKISEALIGRHPTNETRKKLSESHKGILSGNLNPSKRPEIRAKISKNHANFLGENNPNWIDGRSFAPYCPKFNNQKKEQIRKKDNYICQLCNKSQKENKQRLSVHHIHYDKQNCYPDLISLCNKCNSKVNKNRDYWEEYFMKILTNNLNNEWNE